MWWKRALIVLGVFALLLFVAAGVGLLQLPPDVRVALWRAHSGSGRTLTSILSRGCETVDFLRSTVPVYCLPSGIREGRR